MSRSWVFVILCVFGAGAAAEGTDEKTKKSVPWKDCLQDVQVTRGGSCGKKESLQVHAVNRCTDAVDVKICIDSKKKDGSWKWSCTMQSEVKPAEKLNQGHWTCFSNARVHLWARKAGDRSTKLPQEPAESADPAGR